MKKFLIMGMIIGCFLPQSSLAQSEKWKRNLFQILGDIEERQREILKRLDRIEKNNETVVQSLDKLKKGQKSYVNPKWAP